MEGRNDPGAKWRLTGTLMFALASDGPRQEFEQRAREIAAEVMPAEPAPCCADPECEAHAVDVRYWTVRTDLHSAIGQYLAGVVKHDQTDGANCECRNALYMRAMMAEAVILWEHHATFMMQMELERARYAAAEASEASGRTTWDDWGAR